MKGNAFTRKVAEVIDGFYNKYTGLGGKSTDPNNNNGFEDESFSASYWEPVFNTNWVAKRVVALPYDDGVRNGWTLNIESEDQKKVDKKLKSLRFTEHLERAAKLARLKGGSVMFIGAMDGEDPAEPLNVDRIQGISFLRVFERDEISVQKWYDDTDEEAINMGKLGEPELYFITPYTNGSQQPILIHESRLIKFRGEFVTNLKKSSNDGWDDSVFQGKHKQLANYDKAVSSSMSLFNNLVSNILKLEDMTEYLEDPDLLKERVKLSLQSMSVLSAHVIGGSEEFRKETANITGIDKHFFIHARDVSSSFGIPMTVLFGEQLGSLSGAETSTQNYENMVRSYQTTKLLPSMEQFYTLLFQDPSLGMKDKEFKIEFNPIRIETLSEKIANRKTQAETDQIYIQNNVVMPDEISDSRFGGDEYNYETKLDEELRASEDFKTIEEE